VGEFSASGHPLALISFLLLCVLALPAQALVVTIDLGWGYNAGWTDAADAQQNLIDDYHLQVGSIVQVIMFNNASYDPPDGTPGQNFVPFEGEYTGTPIDAVPVPSGGGEDPGLDHNVFDPNTVVEAGNVLAYATEIGTAIDGGAHGYWYHIYAQFEILGNYDSLYIRVFGATNWPAGEVIASYWGISPVRYGTNVVDTWYVPIIDNVAASNNNYFEVIPEPGTLALFMLGGAGLVGERRRRKRALRG
jgi:hypothetical protein